jgi:hypothetical protein
VSDDVDAAVADILARMREAYGAEVERLRLENAALRVENRRLQAKQTGPCRPRKATP